MGENQAIVLFVSHPATYSPERQYIFDVLLRDFLGLSYTARPEYRTDICITCLSENGSKQLFIADVLFSTPEAAWLTRESLPKQPIESWDIARSMLGQKDSPPLPVLYGAPFEEGKYMLFSEDTIRLGIDIFGTAFFFLTRYEEAVITERDQYGRFPAAASLAAQEGWLRRPIVNEYLEALWSALHHLWPGVNRKARMFEFAISHDIDHPRYFPKLTSGQIVRILAAMAVKKHAPFRALHWLVAWCRMKLGNENADPYNTFNEIMQLSEAHGLRSAFYFIAENTNGEEMQSETLDSSWVRSVLRHIHGRGHEIGLHTSFETYRDPAQIRKEFAILKRVCSQEGITQIAWGGRQHYLRWEVPATWQAWADNDLNYDSSLMFSEQVGFRCGICYEYTVFNLRTHAVLSLRERPLIVMDGTLFAKQYMHLDIASAYSLVAQLITQCRRYNGIFTILWHNDSFAYPALRKFYRRILKLASDTE